MPDPSVFLCLPLRSKLLDFAPFAFHVPNIAPPYTSGWAHSGQRSGEALVS